MTKKTKKLPSLLSYNKLSVCLIALGMIALGAITFFFLNTEVIKKSQLLEAESYITSFENICSNHVAAAETACSVLEDEAAIRDTLDHINTGKAEMPEDPIAIEDIISSPQTYNSLFNNYAVNAVTIYFNGQLLYYTLSDRTVDNALNRTGIVYSSESETAYPTGSFFIRFDDSSAYAYLIKDYFNIYNGRYYGKIIIELNPIPSNATENNPYYMVPTSQSLDLQAYPSTVYYLLNSDDRIVFSNVSPQVGSMITDHYTDEILKETGIRLHGQQLYSTSRISSGDLKLLLIINRKDLTASIPWIFIGIIVCCLLLLFLIIVLTSRKYTRAFTKLLDYTSLASKQQQPIFPSEPSDYAETAEIFTAFSDYCKSYNALLEKYNVLKEKQTEHKLTALNDQIDPHFLFNMLDVISWKAVQSKTDDVEEMIRNLSSILRFQINHDEAKISLRQEINYIYQYLGLQKLGGSANFDYTITADNEILDNYRIPKLTLQPLVENSIKHGFRNLPREGILKIEIWEDVDGIVCRISDNGNGFDSSSLESSENQTGNGIALKNIRERLALFYGDPYTVTLASTPGAGTIATVYIPYDSVN